MSEDALVNTGAVQWPTIESALLTVRRMQIKLHRWAAEDKARRFDDLFNLVYDPAFLMNAWERVETNAGAKTAGVDGLTVAGVKTRIGVEAFLEGIRQALKSGTYQPVEVRRVMIPKAGRKFRAGDPDGVVILLLLWWWLGLRGPGGRILRRVGGRSAGCRRSRGCTSVRRRPCVPGRARCAASSRRRQR